MRESEFKEWLQKTGKSKRITKFYVGATKNIARDENKNLDEEFKKNKLNELYELYRYNADDERNGAPNPTKLKTKTNSLHKTLSTYKTALNQYRKFCASGGEVVNDADTETDNDKASELEIQLKEDQLQDIIRHSITDLEAGLEIIDNGVEEKVATGAIDIFAKDSQGRFVVIELKVGTAKGDVIGQTLGYMVDIAKRSGQDIGQVRGIIVASGFKLRVENCAEVIPNLELKPYKHRL